MTHHSCLTGSQFDCIRPGGSSASGDAGVFDEALAVVVGAAAVAGTNRTRLLEEVPAIVDSAAELRAGRDLGAGDGELRITDGDCLRLLGPIAGEVGFLGPLSVNAGLAGRLDLDLLARLLGGGLLLDVLLDLERDFLAGSMAE